MLINILIGIVVISFILLAHELGHFISAKLVKVKVEEFGFGFPPRLLSIKRGDTIYSLNTIPFGGFNKLAGEEDPKVSSGLARRSILTRLFIISAGSVVNILLALLLFSIVFMIPQDVIRGDVIVEEVAPDSPAAMVGIEPGDFIISINSKQVINNYELQRQIQLNLGSKITLTVRHSDSTNDSFNLVPRWKPPEGEGAIGVGITTINQTVIRQSYPFWHAIPKGFVGLYETAVLYKNGMLGVITGAVQADFYGPVGIVQATGEIARYGAAPLLEFAAFISLILGILNLFPLPALDGGRIAFVLLEWIRRGKRVSAKREGLIHLIGFAILMILMLAITLQDIIRIASGESIIP
ncbi:MAG: site-2 protease family protein [Dehalococcoidia bacterium]|nr:MAG: site-2 protease family protein [Dehalococcoidia bacterium]